MSSDREKMRLISNVRSGTLPTVNPQPRSVEAEDAALPVVEGLDFKQLNFSWNPDGTLSKILVEQDDASFTLIFAWNMDGTVSRITRTGLT
jgi:hypothetical protein